MNEAQRLVAVKDQFALKRLSDDALRQIMPVYRQAVDNILLELKYLPADGSIQREFWLRNQLNTVEQQFRAVEGRVKQILPRAQVEAWDEGLKNADAFLRAGGITPPVPQTQLVGTTASGQTVTQTGNLPGLGIGNDPAFISPSNPAGEFIQPSITRQQVLSAAQDRGFSEFLEGKTGANKRNLGLDQLVNKIGKTQTDKIAGTLRAGFLTGESNDQIARRLQAFFSGGTKRQGLAMTEAVVRTGMAEASQAAHDMFYKANNDQSWIDEDGKLHENKLIKEYEWDASNDTRLCPICAPKDGLRFKERGDAPEWPAHWNCRCKILPLTATQAALRDRGDVPDGSFLERREVKKIGGKNEKAPSGWSGENAYKRPKRIDGKMYWVRRKDLPKGQTHAGDMIKRMDDKNKSAILGTKLMRHPITGKDVRPVEAWNDLIKQPKYEKDPQSLVRRLLSGRETPPRGMSGPQKPGPRKPPSSGPKPKPKKPTPKPSPAPAAAPKAVAKPATPKQPSKPTENKSVTAEKAKQKAAIQAANKKVAAQKAKVKPTPKPVPTPKPSPATKAAPTKRKGKTTTDTNYDYDKNWEKLGYEKKTQYRKAKEDIVEWSGNEFEGVRAAQFADARDRGVELNDYERLQTRRLEKGEQRTAGNRARRLEDFIDRAPKYDGTIRRGVAMDTREEVMSTIERYNSGKKNLAIESWTTDQSVSHRFAMGNGDPRPQRMSILVEGNTKGAPINKISGFDDEYEVLVPSGVRYEVVDVKETFVKGNPKGGRATKMDHTDWTVTLREVKD